MTNYPLEPAPPPKGRPHKGLGVAIIFAGVMLLCLLGSCLALASNLTDNPNLQNPPAATPTVTPDPDPSTGGAAPVLTEGSWQVAESTDVDAGTLAPGTWKVTADKSGLNCYWARLRNFDGDLDSVIANGNIAPGKTFRVTVKAADMGLELRGECQARR
jgi:hypothetical protein